MAALFTENDMTDKTASAGGTPLKHKLMRNTVANLIGDVWTVLVGLALTRYIIYSIGWDAFGLWVVLEAAVGHFGLADLGIRTSFGKFVSNLYAQKKYREINEVLSSGMLYYAAFGTLIVVAGWSLRSLIFGFLRIAPELQQDATFIFVISLLIFVSEHIFRAFGALQVGLQRMDITTRIRVFITIPYAIGLYLFIHFGYGLRGVVLNFALRFVLETTVNIIVAYRLLPSLSIRWRFVNWKAFKEMFSFGFKLQLLRWEDMVVFYTDKILIKRYLGAALVALYELGLKVSRQVIIFSMWMDSALVPAVSEADALGQSGVIDKIHARGSKYIMLFSTPLLGFSAAAAPVIMRIWMGQPCIEAVQVIRVFMLTFFIVNISKIARSICIGINLMRFYLWSSFVQVVLNVALSLWLIFRVGFIGVVWATCISCTASTVIFMIFYHRRFRVGMWPMLRDMMLKYALGAAIPCAVFIWLNSRHILLLGGTVAGLSTLLLIEGLLYGMFYLAYVFLFGGTDSYDRAQLKQVVRSLLRKSV